MSAASQSGAASGADRRLDPARDRRRYAWFFAGLFVVYAGSLFVYWPRAGGAPDEAVFAFLMFAPTVGALLARFLAPGTIRWGRPSWWILAALLPIVVVLAVTLIGAGPGRYTVDLTILRSSLVGAATATLLASILAAGEEIGWRGFLWPLLRTRISFLGATVVVGVIWWAYHLPFIITGWYGSLGGLPAFTVALAGATLVAGVLTDRSQSVWPAVVTHGAWNALVATSFSAQVGDVEVPAFTGNDVLLGEFGWVAAVTVFVVGVAAAAWHVRDLHRRAREATAAA